MNTLQTIASDAKLVLAAETAADLMTSNPVSVRETATIPEATRLLTSKGISGVPVIDEAGRPVGVLSQTDLLIHHTNAAARPETAQVRALMTPVVFSVRPHTPAAEVVREMTALKVHRVFVVDRQGILVGVVSALDVLNALRP
jgi:CBS-domain-containing membrane protein